MPQLLPYFFVNMISFAFVALFVMLYFFSKYILPNTLQLFVTRIYISKLLFN